MAFDRKGFSTVRNKHRPTFVNMWNFFQGLRSYQSGLRLLIFGSFFLIAWKGHCKLNPKNYKLPYLDLDVAGTLQLEYIRTLYLFQGCGRMPDILSNCRTMFKNIEQFTNFKKKLDRFPCYKTMTPDQTNIFD